MKDAKLVYPCLPAYLEGYPGKRESRKPVKPLDSRVRGNDTCEYDAELSKLPELIEKIRIIL
jgi:hypothetical protein